MACLKLAVWVEGAVRRSSLHLPQFAPWGARMETGGRGGGRHAGLTARPVSCRNAAQRDQLEVCVRIRCSACIPMVTSARRVGNGRTPPSVGLAISSRWGIRPSRTAFMWFLVIGHDTTCASEAKGSTMEHLVQPTGTTALLGKLRDTWLVHQCLSVRHRVMRRSEGEVILLRKYSRIHGKSLDLTNSPQTFTEKLFWRMITWNRGAMPPRFTQLSD